MGDPKVSSHSQVGFVGAGPAQWDGLVPVLRAGTRSPASEDSTGWFPLPPGRRLRGGGGAR